MPMFLAIAAAAGLVVTVAVVVLLVGNRGQNSPAVSQHVPDSNQIMAQAVAAVHRSHIETRATSFRVRLGGVWLKALNDAVTIPEASREIASAAALQAGIEGLEVALTSGMDGSIQVEPVEGGLSRHSPEGTSALPGSHGAPAPSIPSPPSAVQSQAAAPQAPPLTSEPPQPAPPLEPSPAPIATPAAFQGTVPVANATVPAGFTVKAGQPATKRVVVTWALASGATGGPIVAQQGESITVGRVGTSIQLADPTVSNAHLRLRLVADQVEVTDLGSTNATRVDLASGRKLTPHQAELFNLPATFLVGPTTRLCISGE